MAIKLLGGTLARGIMWIAAALAARYGVEALHEDTATALGGFAAAAVIAGVSSYWSTRKNTALLNAAPPAPAAD